MIEGLEPEALWRYFREIARIPRDSKKEAQARQYVIRAADVLGLACKTDKAGNVLVSKPGVAGKAPLILQAHLDMVCEKDKATLHDFAKDPITLVHDGDWIRAEGTTLGADNGIGVAALLAIMEAGSLLHPPLELLFTVDEETGLTGAGMMEAGFFSGRILINLDSEEDGTLTVGCAGGKDTDLTLDIPYGNAPKSHIPALIQVKGLRGGHSGTDIHEGRGNAIKLLTRFLLNAPVDCLLASMSGGSKHNAIPREAEAVVFVDPQDIPLLESSASQYHAVFDQELSESGDHAQLSVHAITDAGRKAISQQMSKQMLDILNALPHGVISVDIQQGMVMTPTNLAICRIKDGSLRISTNQRSIYPTAVKAVSDQVASIGRIAGAHVIHGHAYPAWIPDFASPVLGVAKGAYKTLFGAEPRVKVVHAGLECGVIGDKNPGIDMLSIGPTIEQAHSPSERMNIASVQRFYQFLLRILEDLAGA